MSRFISLAVLLVSVPLLARPAPAQDQAPPTIFMTSWMCERGAIGDLVTAARERELPVMQELVDEGRIDYHSVMVHHWGDEWNYVTMMAAADMSGGLAALEEFNTRYEARHGTDDSFVDRCPTHRDGIYVGAYRTDFPATRPTVPYSVALSYFNCPLNQISGIVEAERAAFLPAAQASVDAGMGFSLGVIRHAWADDWTYVMVRRAQDVPSLIAFNDDTNRRVAANGAAPGPSLDLCPAHKDNIYQLVMETQPRNR
jgi:hypothetical protein